MVSARDVRTRVCVTMMSEIVTLATYYQQRTNSMVHVKRTIEAWNHHILKKHNDSWQTDTVLVSVDETRVIQNKCHFSQRLANL